MDSKLAQGLHITSAAGIEPQGTISLKLLVGKLAPKLVYFVLKKELLNFSEMTPRPLIPGSNALTTRSRALLHTQARRYFSFLYALNSVTFEYFTERQCEVRSLSRATNDGHCLDSNPRPLITVTGSDTFQSHLPKSLHLQVICIDEQSHTFPGDIKSISIG